LEAKKLVDQVLTMDIQSEVEKKIKEWMQLNHLEE
jgi:hypothetical protein